MTMPSFALLAAGTLGLLVPVVRPGSAVAAPKPAAADAVLDRALRELVEMPGGPVFQALRTAEEQAVCAALAR